MADGHLTVLRVAFGVDALVTLAFCLMMFRAQRGSLMDGWFQQELADRPLVRETLGTIWLGMGLCLVAGVFAPVLMAPILIAQLIYKLAWIVRAIIARWRTESRREIPYTLLNLFVLYCLVYPWLIPWSQLARR
ncbi:hypothetical protein SH661x_001375 [Planctomicrobium sp. SH661]|uniref:hypothetical protein n=1 Tax=Planctomicrobium sp. SH661 TaxID=3448124 RepID=UPI003F5AFD5F